jgi:uncharacterized RDD family membrane protein YckC
MDGGALPERLRRARAACGEELSALSRRTGIRLQHLRAIEDGRFGDLPPGIYARSAVRAFAEACHLDPAGVLAECEPWLPRVDDPIGALARKHRSANETSVPLNPTPEPSAPEPHWQLLAASAVDAAVVGVLLLVLVVVAAAVVRVPIAALSGSPAPLGLMGLVIAGGYFLWFGGLVGATLGRLAVHASTHVGECEQLTLRTIAERALSSAAEDARAIVSLGVLARQRAARLAGPSRSARPPEPSLWPLPLRGRAPVLWLPGNRPGVGPPPTSHQPQG